MLKQFADGEERLKIKPSRGKKAEPPSPNFLDLIEEAAYHKDGKIHYHNKIIEDIMNSLSDRQREVLELSVIYELSTKAIATAKGCSERNIRKLRERGLHNLCEGYAETLKLRASLTFAQRKFLEWYDAGKPELPMNDNFADVKQTLLSGSWFFPAGVAPTEQYIGMFFPFHKEMAKTVPSNISIAALSGREPVYELVFSRYYGEKVQWIVTYFYELFRCFFAHLNFENEDDAELRVNSRKIVSEFPKHKMRYAINSATRFSVHFTSLKSLIDFAFTASITKEEKPMKICKHCNKVYYNENVRSEFCSGRCRNQWNVYKSRGNKNKGE